MLCKLVSFHVKFSYMYLRNLDHTYINIIHTFAQSRVPFQYHNGPLSTSVSFKSEVVSMSVFMTTPTSTSPLTNDDSFSLYWLGYQEKWLKSTCKAISHAFCQTEASASIPMEPQSPVSSSFFPVLCWPWFPPHFTNAKTSRILVSGTEIYSTSFNESRYYSYF